MYGKREISLVSSECRRGVADASEFSFLFRLAGLKVIRNTTSNSQISQHFVCFFSFKKSEIIVQRHDTAAAVPNRDAASAQCGGQRPSMSFGAHGVPLGVGGGIVIWFFRQSQRKRLGLSWSLALAAPSRL